MTWRLSMVWWSFVPPFISAGEKSESWHFFLPELRFSLPCHTHIWNVGSKKVRLLGRFFDFFEEIMTSSPTFSKKAGQSG
ncbi:MAG: hypothetical protein IKZ13_06890 [Akkermansia sp.]|nr:hypothetical protein [Akkermansia sp.]